MEKNIKIQLGGLENLDEETLGMLIDSLVEFYQNKYGMSLGKIELDEPEIPDYNEENFDLAKNYLKKFRLQ